MKCSRCGTENSERVKFCAECGAALLVSCPHCSFKNPASAPRCAGCGKSFHATAAPPAERRQITVFFADIAGSTKLAESLDPEDLRELYARYQALCGEALQHYEGHVAQFLGDGVLAYFGYPAAHEDDAARSVRAGLELLERIATLNIAGHRPRVRIGIDTGVVVVGDIGAGARREQLALGEAPNIAARLQAEALPNTMVISDATRRLVAGQFEVEDLGSRTLKGVSKPMRIFRVLGKSAAKSRFQARTTVTGLTKFLGRERELERIRGAWEQAAGGRGQVIILRGEAGIGKSRLLAAAGKAAANQAHESWEAECSPYQMNTPLYPVLEMISRRAGIEENLSPADRIERLEQFAAGRSEKFEEAVAALAELLAIPASEPYFAAEIPAAKRRQWSIEVLAGLLLVNGDGSPILLRIEDLHWADPSTLDLLDAMIARLADRPVLIAASTRPEFAARWTQHAHSTEIRVEPLPPEDTRALVATVVGPKPLPLSLVRELVARTRGVPLFVEAVTHTVMEAGILTELDDRFELTGPLPPGLIPATVQDSLMARIDRLGADRTIAQVAATMGREFSFELLEAVLGKTTEELAHGLRHLIDLNLVSESGTIPTSIYTFKHALIQDAAYESLLRKTRQEFHGKIAEVLNQRFPEMAETNPALLARHYEGAGRIEEATRGWMKAGSQAQKRSALRECVAYLEKALGLLQTVPEEDPGRLRSEMEVQLELSHALMPMLGWGSHEVEAACLRVRDLSRKLNDSTFLLRSSLGLSTLYFLRGSMRQTWDAAKSVLEVAQAAGDPMLEVAARHVIGYASLFQADFAQAREHGEKGLALYDPEREREVLASFQYPSSWACANSLTMCLWYTGYPDQAEQVHRNGWQIIDKLNLPAATMFALCTSLLVYYARREYGQTAAGAEQLHALATQEGFLFFAAWARIYRGWAQAMQGDAAGGIVEMEAGLETYRLTNSGLAMPQFRLMMAEAQWRAQRPRQALDSISAGLRHACEYHEHLAEPELHRLRGEILPSQGDRAGGEASLQRAIEVAQSQRAKTLELRAAIALAKFERGAESVSLLQSVYDWFQEGCDTPELVEARALLNGIRSASAAPR